MTALFYLLGFVSGVFLYYTLSLIISAKRRRNTVCENDTTALRNIINY